MGQCKTSRPPETDDAARDAAISFDPALAEAPAPAARPPTRQRRMTIDEMTEAWAELELEIASLNSNTSSLDDYYDAWAKDELSPQATRMLMCAPPEPSTQLLWWQWVERCRHIEAHDPPQFQPQFMRKPRAPEVHEAAARGEFDSNGAWLLLTCAV